jgi:hypothetical protein
VNVTLDAQDTHSFTVVFVFSGLIDPRPPEADSYSWNLTFPLYPSLVQTFPICDVTVILPPNVGNFTDSDSNLAEKAVNVTTTTIDSRQTREFSTRPLESFARESVWLRFYQESPSETDMFLMVDADEVRRDITIDEWGGIFVSDFYHITNRGELNFTGLKLRLPQQAVDISWRDAKGEEQAPWLEGNATTSHINATIDFGTLEKDEAAKFTVTYGLPWKEYIAQNSWRSFTLALDLFECEYFDWILNELVVTVNLPNDAEYQSSSVPPQSMKGSITFARDDVTPFHDLGFHMTYDYVVFSASFYPTLWMGLLVTVIGALALLWRAPKPTPVAVAPVSPEAVRSFVGTYERKIDALRELETLEEQVRRRKISRRRYKVRKKALEGRLSVFAKDLTDVKEKLREAGSRYASLTRQIEVAETALEETEAAIRRIKARYRRREISKGTYSKLLEEYTSRKERAETTIDGVLLRLREELR